MLLEIFSHALVFDIGWFVEFVLRNLLWFFIFACLGVFIYGKNSVTGAIFAGLYLFTTFDFGIVLGWVFRKGFFWAPIIGFLSLMAYDAFFGKEGSKHLKRPWFASGIFYVGLIGINYFLV